MCPNYVALQLKGNYNARMTSNYDYGVQTNYALHVFNYLVMIIVVVVFIFIVMVVLTLVTGQMQIRVPRIFINVENSLHNLW